jgi:periodic tryptophan protein 2
VKYVLSGTFQSLLTPHSNKSHTLPFAHRKNIAKLGLTPRGNLLLSIDEDGHAILTNVPRRIALHYFSFKSPVSALAFSPSGRYFAVGVGKNVEIWHTPSTPDQNVDGELEFAPFVRHRVYTGHFDTIQSLEWSSDSRFFLSAAKDLTARIFSLDPEEGFLPTTLSGHREGVLAAYFSKDQEKIYTISKDGAVFRWEYLRNPRAPELEDSEDEQMAIVENPKYMQWRIAERHYFLQSNTKVSCVAYHADSNILVAGFSNGVFGLYEMPEFNMIHSLSISQNDIDFVTINKTGEWLAFGASKLGQLLVWEWQSESYILKQQGHYDSMNALVYTPDGQRVITTADDGKIKVWDVRSGFCIVTFTEHSSGVTACEFTKKGNVLFTASLDGSVRAWDLIRYRNFRTFTAPTRTSFSSLAIDPSGEVVCAGSRDIPEIHTWSVQTGQLLDTLDGHESPVSALAFAPDGSVLVSGSWDKSVRIWNIFGRTPTSERLQLQADVVDVAVRPDSKQLVVSSIDGQLTFWNISEAQQQSGVDGRRDVSGGRKISDRRTAANSADSKWFSTIRYSSDGSCVLAAGNSKYICLYSVDSLVLLKKYTVSVNLSLSGTQEFLNSKQMLEAGPAGLLDDQGEASDLENRIDKSLPGSKRGGDPSARKKMPEVRVSGVAFSPAGRSFCAASTEGLLIYSLDTEPLFDPIDLDLAVTPASTIHVLQKEKDYLKALVMAFRLNEAPLVRKVFEGIPHTNIGLVVEQLPVVYLPRLLRFVAIQAEESPHLEFCLLWIQAILVSHGKWVSDNRGSVEAELRTVHRAVTKIKDELRRIAEDNVYTIDYLLSQPREAEKAEDSIDQNLIMIGEADDVVGMDEDDDPEWIGLD